MAALDNLKKRLRRATWPAATRIEVVDLLVNPRLAAGDQILAVPTLVRKFPEPIRKIIGDLSNEERVLVGPRRATASARTSMGCPSPTNPSCLRLYVTGGNAELRAGDRQHAPPARGKPSRASYALEIIDIAENVALATADQIVCAPTLRAPRAVAGAPNHRRHVGHRTRAQGAGSPRQGAERDRGREP